MKRLIPIVMLAATVAGCASSSMKSTPFYSGSERVYTGRIEDRVNLWPLMYWREPALSVAWPIYSQADDHWAIHPICSQYRQGGKDAGYDEFNFLWPFCQFDTKHDEHRVFPMFWGEDHFDVFPVFFWTKNWCVIGPYATHKTEDRGTLFPLSWWDLDKERFWYLAGLGGYWKCDDYRVNHWMLPLYLKNRSGFYSLPFSRLNRDGLTEDLYLCGLGGHEFTPDGYRCSWAFPFYYHDKDGCCTLLCGNTATSDWLMPFYFRNETDFHTPVWSVRANEKTGEKGFFSLPLLSAAFWNTNTCARSWYAPLGIVGSKTNTSGTYREYWAFPFYSCRKNVRFDEHLTFLDVPQKLDDRSPYSVDYKSYLLLFDDDETFRAKRIRGESDEQVELTYRRKVGNWLFFDRKTNRTVCYDEAKDVVEKDDEREETSFLLFLYRAESKLDRLTHKSSASHRILWKLWDWERRDEDVTLDVFPFFTYDSRASGYSKTSLLWRLFRNEYDPKTDTRAVDVLFIPVWR